jgi:hypothetical protein
MGNLTQRDREAVAKQLARAEAALRSQLASYDTLTRISA